MCQSFHEWTQTPDSCYVQWCLSSVAQTLSFQIYLNSLYSTEHRWCNHNYLKPKDPTWNLGSVLQFKPSSSVWVCCLWNCVVFNFIVLKKMHEATIEIKQNKNIYIIYKIIYINIFYIYIYKYMFGVQI